MRWRVVIRRVLRTILIGTIVVLVLIAAVATLLSLSPVRHRILRKGLDVARRELPGSLTVARARWPSLGTLSLEGILWIDRGDTLLAAKRVELSTRVRPLLQRDLHVERIRVEGAIADLVAIQQSFPPQDEAAVEEPEADESAGGFPFLRLGALSPFPSVAVDEVRVSVDRLKMAEGSSVRNAKLALGADLLKHHNPTLWLEELTAASPDQGWWLDGFTLATTENARRAKGEIRARIGPEAEPWPVQLALSLEPSTFEDQDVRLVIETANVQPGQPVLRVDLHADTRELRPRSVRFDVRLVTPSTGELAGIPQLASQLRGVPDLAGVQIDVAGSAELAPEVSTHARLRVAENDWLEGALIDVHTSGGIVELDSLEIRLPDLVASARGRWTREELDASMSLRATGARWLAMLAPDATTPDSLDLRLGATLRGPPAALAVEASLEAAATVSNFTLQRLTLDAATPSLAEQPISFDLVGQALDMELTVQGRVQLGDTLSARLSPLRLRDVSSPALPATLDEPASLAFVPATGAATLQRLRLVGDAGEIRLDASLDAAKKGEFDLAASWPEAPRLLLARLGLDEEKETSLREAWQRSPAFALSVGGPFDLSEGNPRMKVKGMLVVPGPATLAPLLPPGVRVEGLGALHADFQLSTEPTSEGSHADLALDLAATDWIDVGRTDARLRGSHVTLDSLRLDLEGISLRAAGSVADSLLDLAGSLQIRSTDFLSRFVTADSLALDLSSAFWIRGTTSAPTVRADLTARASLNQIEIPVLEVSASLSESGLSADAVAAEGLSTGSLRLDRVVLGYRSESVSRGVAAGQPQSADPSDAGGTKSVVFPGHLWLDASGADLALRQSLRVDQDAGWTVRVDTLDLVLLEKDLRLARPFDLRVEQPGNAISLAGLALEGTLGSIQADAIFASDSVTVVLDVDLIPPDAPEALQVSPDLWPGSIRLHVLADDDTGVKARGEISGFVFGKREGVSLEFDVDASSDDTSLNLSVLDEGQEVLRGQARIPLSVTLTPVSGELRDESLDLELLFTEFLLPLLEVDGDPAKAPVLNGQISIGGTVTDPSLESNLAATFPNLPLLSKHRLDVDARLAAAEPAASGPGSDPSVDPALHRANLTLAALLGDGTVRLIEANLSVPVRWNTDSLTVGVDSTRVVDLEIHSNQLALDTFNPVLPPSVSLAGTLDLALSAHGPPRQLDLSGSLKAKKALASGMGGNRVTLDADLNLGGTSQRPKVTGQIDVQNGILRIPEQQRSLHPAEGEAVLWTVEGMHAEALEEEATVANGKPGSKPTAIQAETNVKVRIPGGFWIRGRNLEVELAGDLSLIQRGAGPTVSGELQALRGSLVFMGRTLQVTRGRVTFYGEDELDPGLDLLLSAKIERTTVEIVITGTATRPELELRSNPEMEQGDIMSVLLFGRPSNELDENQMALLGQRAGDVLAAYAAAELTERLSGQLGVDMISVRSGSGSDDASALVVGKYLNTRTLLKYEQALQSGQHFFLVMEYALTRDFRLDTRYGSQNKSAIELNWGRDY